LRQQVRGFSSGVSKFYTNLKNQAGCATGSLFLPGAHIGEKSSTPLGLVPI